jgi:hypothetical protein
MVTSNAENGFEQLIFRLAQNCVASWGGDQREVSKNLKFSVRTHGRLRLGEVWQTNSGAAIGVCHFWKVTPLVLGSMR